MTAPAACWCGGGVAFHDGEQGYICTDSVFHDPTAVTGTGARVRTLYVAGPMSGYPMNNYPAFHEAADLLRAAGYTVRNPAEAGAKGGSYVDLIREDLRLLIDCDAVAVLEGWWGSVGARNEVQVAGVLGLPVRSLREWLQSPAAGGARTA